MARPELREERAMGMRLRHRDPVFAGTPAAAAARSARGSSIARTLRTAWWPRFAVAGLVLTAVGATLLSGTAQALVAVGGMVASRALGSQALLHSSADS